MLDNSARHGKLKAMKGEYYIEAKKKWQVVSFHIEESTGVIQFSQRDSIQLGGITNIRVQKHSIMFRAFLSSGGTWKQEHVIIRNLQSERET